MSAKFQPALPLRDLEEVAALVDAGVWEAFRNQRLFVTGATGFFGCWLLETFAFANEKFNLNATLVALTRNAAAFASKAPHLANQPAIQFHEGDVRTFAFPAGEFAYVIHGATQASAALNDASPLVMLDTIVDGTRHVLDFALQCKARRVLFTSSGAIYGRQPDAVTHVAEDFTGGPELTNSASAYGEGKRLAELLCTIYHKAFKLDTVLARCFAFVGPHLPLDTHFAAGNFIRDGIAGGTIQIKGDGTPCRSYLYMSDLAVWLWTLLVKGTPLRPYNVGSDVSLSIADTARTVARCFTPERVVHVALQADPSKAPARYVPSVERAKTELGLRISVPVDEAFRRSVAWYESQKFAGSKTI